MRNYSVKKRDASEPAIIAALERCGCLVDQVDGRPYDLVVERAGRLFLLECKSSKRAARAKTAPNARQAKFRRSGWPVHVVTEPIDALRVVGLVDWRARVEANAARAHATLDAEVERLESDWLERGMPLEFSK